MMVVVGQRRDGTVERVHASARSIVDVAGELVAVYVAEFSARPLAVYVEAQPGRSLLEVEWPAELLTFNS